MPGITIDGHSVKGITIDGHDVKEVTMDGYVVWSAGRKITVSERSGRTLYNYAVPVNFGSGDEIFNASEASVRFQDSGGSVLSHHKEYYNSGSSARYWVKVPNIPSNGTADIFAIYGDGTSWSSDSRNTFSYYDDFSTNRGWNTNSGRMRYSGSKETIGGHTDTTRTEYITKTVSVPNNFAFEVDLRPGGGYSDEVFSRWNIGVGNFTGKSVDDYNNNDAMTRISGGGPRRFGTSVLKNGSWRGLHADDNTWHRHDPYHAMVGHDNGYYFSQLRDGFGTTGSVISSGSKSGQPQNSYNRIGIWDWENDYSSSYRQYGEIHEWRLRPYANPEPSVSVS